MSPPKLPKSRKRGILALRLSADEVKLIEKAAKLAIKNHEADTRTGWIRDVVLLASKRRIKKAAKK
ncbi:MAG: hypothetical protein ACYTGN_14445 [Planctomycetota bacterium]|jgi:uncharacterized protein (DUF1778 family)